MPDAVICEPLRTPVGRFGGVFRDVAPEDLAATVITELVTRTGLTGADIDDVILGQASRGGEAPAIGRIDALNAGLGVDVPGLQVDRRCGSGLQAIIQAVMQVQSGGVESMSQAEFYATGMRYGVRGESLALRDRLVRARMTAGGRNYPVPGGMIETAENLRTEFGISRTTRTPWPCSPTSAPSPRSAAASSRSRWCGSGAGSPTSRQGPSNTSPPALIRRRRVSPGSPGRPTRSTGATSRPARTAA